MPTQPRHRIIAGQLYQFIPYTPSWLDRIFRRDPGGVWQPVPRDYER